MKCNHCNKENPEGAKYCMFCGAELVHTITCPKCGTTDLPSEAQFCYHCGEKLTSIQKDAEYAQTIIQYHYVLVPIENEYDEVESSPEGLFSAKINGKCGFINKKGKEVIPCIYDEASFFSEGLVLVKDEGEDQMFINPQGQVVFTPEAYPVGYLFKEGLFQTFKRIDGRWLYGFFNKQGSLVIDYQFLHVYDFSEGLAIAQGIDGLVGYIDHSGNYTIPPIYKMASEFKKGYAAVLDQDDCYLLIDKDGNTVYEFDGILEESGGIHIHFDESLYFKLKGQNVVLNPLNGAYLTCEEWENIYIIGGGYVCVYDKDDENIRLIKDGKEVIDLEYDNIQHFDEGYAIVEKDGKKGIVDSSLREIAPCVFDEIGYFYDKSTIVEKDGTKQILLIS